MDNRIGAVRIPGFVGIKQLEQEITRRTAEVARQAPLVLRALQSGFQAQQTGPVALNPQLSQLQTNVQPISVRDLQRMQQTGGLTQTNAELETLRRMLPPADYAMVAGKVQELIADGRSLDQTGRPRFAANLALEISEHIGAGKPVSPQLNGLFNKLVQDGRSVFEANPTARAVLQSNLAARALNLPSVLEGVPGIDRTRATTTSYTAALNPVERKMVETKVLELVRDNLSVEKTNPSRFAANLALEISEHIGSGYPVSAELAQLFQQLMKDGESVFRSNPRAVEVINHNLGSRARNLN